MRLVGYIRVSRVGGREGESFISPKVQRQTIEAMAQAGGHTVIAWNEQDLDVSGGSLQREGIEECFRMVEAGEVDGIAVAKLDRFSRSVLDTEKAIERIEKARGIFLAADLGLDTSKPEAKLMRTMMAGMAQFQRDRIREGWNDANVNAIKRGVRSGAVPIGYKRNGEKRLVPSEDAQGVRDLFRMRSEGMSWASIARELEGTTGRTWGHSTMRRIVNNPVYLGDLHRGDLVNRNAHEPLVDRATFEAAQSTPGVNRGRAGTLLGGLIRCATCGHCMAHQVDRSRNYRTYRCFKLHAGITCPTGCAIGAEKAEEYVTEQFLSWASSVRVEAEPRTDTTDAALAALEAAETELALYRDANLVSVIGADAYREGLEHRANVVNEARAAVIEARRESNIDTVGGSDVAGVWDSLTTQEKRTLLGAAIDRVVCVKAPKSGRYGTPVEDRLTIVWAGDTPS